ncbi:hypothetical protein AB0F03_19005 [Streptomyces sp. NPDC028722]
MERVAIIGRDVRLVEQVITRMRFGLWTGSTPSSPPGSSPCTG